MSGIGGVTMSYLVALHPEGVDRNQQCLYLPLGWDGESPSTRRAWIEICPKTVYIILLRVALHPEGVDRNNNRCTCLMSWCVALHPEGVDRNRYSFRHFFRPRRVALHPEGVDRNFVH